MSILDGIPRLPDQIEINGIRFSGVALVQVLSSITNPIPNRWYKFERKGDQVLVTMRDDEQGA